MADLFGTLGDGAEVTLSGTLGDEMGVNTLSGHGFFEYGGELFYGVDLIGAHFGDLDSVRLMEKSDDYRSGLYGHISWSCVWH